MFLKDGLVYRKFVSPDGLAAYGRLYILTSLRNEFLSIVHTGMTGVHLGRSETGEQLARRAYSPSSTSDVRWFLRRCDKWARYDRGKSPRQTRLHPFMAGEPFELISIDITGSHPPSCRGNQYILTVIDSFSKWAEAFAIRNHADIVDRLLVTYVFARFGVPKQLISDRGSEFESQLMENLYGVMQIDKLRTTSFKASTSGATLNAMLAKVMKDDQRDG